MRYFFYGTLTDADVLALVLGRRLAADALRPARLEGCRLAPAAEEPYPVPVPEPDAAVEGFVVEDLNAEDRARIAFIEDSEYRTRRAQVRLADGRGVRAHIHLDSDLEAVRGAEWDLDDWRAEERPDFLVLTAQWMAHFGARDLAAAEAEWDRTRDELLARRARAFSRGNAE